MEKITIRLQTEIEATPKEVYDFLLDPHKIPLVMPGLLENAGVQLPLKEGSSFTFRYLMYGVMLEGKWTVTKLEDARRYEAQTTGVTSAWKYELVPRGRGTQLSLTVELEPPQSVLRKAQLAVVRKINENAGEAYFRNLKTVLELQKH